MTGSPRRKDLTGRQFGRLTVLYWTETRALSRNAVWRCQCECGIKPVVAARSLVSGAATSCGCFRKERSAAANRKRLTTHGMAYTRTFRIWGLMLNRCRNERATQFKHYGGRGIKVCDAWREFAEFFKDMGEAPDGLTLDRIDSNGNYEPSNCRWASKVQQMNNMRRTRIVTVDGRTMTMSEASREFGVGVGTIWSRLKLGWPDEKAVKKKVKLSAPESMAEHP